MIDKIIVTYQCTCERCTKQYRRDEELKNKVIDKEKNIITVSGKGCKDRRFSFCSAKCWREAAGI